jgi:hypothetical protein
MDSSIEIAPPPTPCSEAALNINNSQVAMLYKSNFIIPQLEEEPSSFKRKTTQLESLFRLASCSVLSQSTSASAIKVQAKITLAPKILYTRIILTPQIHHLASSHILKK